ncbi:DNA-binding response regulator, OmpR family, contains REC and winged-helix (wHTH) domain [Sinosporangium album]|uniref:DNA-binding response regulator, OmpR family, contains REC and winged-helix (WHTH) domain n=1 Tax=Sinosporangium album TaxID=504805 RepID=A0A1G7Z227_9ACTN|nr:response regulator transcription factor [Sinosporangium album]SDH02625.1 DNA-binding response regulator, OmpR family, contains REC and winged-helix (wHTH) domain [Sinosporangium album]
MRVLLVEDNESITEPLVDGLSQYGFTVHQSRTGADALRAPLGDIVLLDLGLPDMDGIDVCRQLRRNSEIPIIILSARGEETDRVVGLEIGADDYVAKPFSLRELVARMRAVTRRTRTTAAPAPAEEVPAPSGARILGELVIDRRTRQVQVRGHFVALTPKEFDLLALLSEDPGAVCPREHILRNVWDPNFFGSTKTLDFHIATLRRKLGNPTWIRTVRGVGFSLVVPASSPPGQPAEFPRHH